MPRRKRLRSLHFVEVADVPDDGLIVRKDGRTFVAPLPEQLADVSASGEEVFVVPKDQLLSTNEAAKLLGISTSRVKQLLDAGAVPFETVGRDRRIRTSDAIAFREERQRRREGAAGGFISPTELERPEPSLEEILEDVE